MTKELAILICKWHLQVQGLNFEMGLTWNKLSETSSSGMEVFHTYMCTGNIMASWKVKTKVGVKQQNETWSIVLLHIFLVSKCPIHQHNIGLIVPPPKIRFDRFGRIQLEPRPLNIIIIRLNVPTVRLCTSDKAVSTWSFIFHLSSLTWSLKTYWTCLCDQ
jgi:hypothetical protein